MMAYQIVERKLLYRKKACLLALINDFQRPFPVSNIQIIENK